MERKREHYSRGTTHNKLKMLNFSEDCLPVLMATKAEKKAANKQTTQKKAGKMSEKREMEDETEKGK